MHYTGTTSQEILSYLHHLPPNSRIRIALRVDSIGPLQNVVLSMGTQRVSYLDLTSMGLSLQSGVEQGAVLWFSGSWTQEPTPLGGGKSLTITAVYGPVRDGSCLQFFYEEQ